VCVSECAIRRGRALSPRGTVTCVWRWIYILCNIAAVQRLRRRRVHVRALSSPTRTSLYVVSSAPEEAPLSAAYF
jgi:hypothetical protein